MLKFYKIRLCILIFKKFVKFQCCKDEQQMCHKRAIKNGTFITTTTHKYKTEKEIVKPDRKSIEKDRLLKAKEERENEVLRKTEERIRQIKVTIQELDRELEMLEFEKKKLKPRATKISSDI